MFDEQSIDELIRGFGVDALLSSEFQSDSQDELSSSRDVTSACLLGLVHRFDVFSEALAIRVIHNRVEKLVRKTKRSLEMYVSEREANHGPCPRDVWISLRDEVYRKAGRLLLFCGTLPTYIEISPPKKGTKERDAYNKWMKKKVGKKVKQKAKGESADV